VAKFYEIYALLRIRIIAEDKKDYTQAIIELLNKIGVKQSSKIMLKDMEILIITLANF
jgi:hypothetical protein